MLPKSVASKDATPLLVSVAVSAAIVKREPDAVTSIPSIPLILSVSEPRAIEPVDEESPATLRVVDTETEPAAVSLP